jgi:hypothetical protein
MTVQTLKQSSGIAAPVDAGHRSREAASSRGAYAWLIGALFLAGFLVYGVGFGLVTSVISAPDFLATMAAHQTTLVFGAFLMLLNTVVDIGKGVLFFPIVERHGKRTALVYLAAITVQVVLLDLGVLCLLMLVPLGQYAVDVAGASAAWATGLGALLTQGNTLAYHIGQATLGFGGIFLCALLFRARLLPRFLSAWGFIGYAIHVAGAIAEIFGIHVSLLLLIPGGLFELALGFWLIFQGFQRQPAINSRDEPAAVTVAA